MSSETEFRPFRAGMLVVPLDPADLVENIQLACRPGRHNPDRRAGTPHRSQPCHAVTAALDFTERFS